MKYSHTTNQVSLFDFQKLGFNIPQDDELVQLSDAIDWDMLVEKIQHLYSNKGRNAKSIRMMIALEIAKPYYKDISDQQLVKSLRTDVVLMYFCGFSSPLDIPASLDSSTMTKFRNRLTPEVLQSINEEAIKGLVKKMPRRKRGQVASDTTVLPANITYPTDTGLLTKVSNRLTQVIEEVRSQGGKVVNRGRQKLEKILQGFNKKKRKAKKEIKQVKRLLINQTRRQLRTIRQHTKNLSKKTQKELHKIQSIVRQQIIMYKEGSKRVGDRIVSLHEDKIRPIYRGKINATTEFGKKVSLQVIGQALILSNKIEYNNFSDTHVPQEDIKQFERIFERAPKEYSFDRGHSPSNHELLEEKKIHDGIQYRGRIPKKAKVPPKKQRKRMSNQRSVVEGKIGTLKTRYGMDRIGYKAENTEVRFQMGIFLHNMKWAIRV